jgi:hypothetical protein
MELSHLPGQHRRADSPARAPQRRIIRLATLIAVTAATLAAFSPSAFAGIFDTTTTLDVTPSIAIVGAPVTMTATVTGTGALGVPPVGLVTFYNELDNSSIGQPVTLVPKAGSVTTSTATLVTTELQAGTYSVRAAYGGDLEGRTATGSTSAPVPLTVGAGSGLHVTHVTLTADTLNVETNQPVTITAVVTEDGGAVIPVGTVSFADTGNGNGAPVPLGTVTVDGTGTATLIVPDFFAGTHTIIASYSGSARDSGSSATLILNAHDPVDARVQTTITVSTSPATITADDVVTITAHVVQAGTTTPPAGNNVVLFTSDGPLGNNVLLGQSNALDGDGNASITLGGWLTGDYTITASYNGNVFAHGSVGEVQLTVLPGRSPSSLAYTGGPTGDYRDPATLSATLTDEHGTPLTGRTVTFTLGSQTCTGITDSAGIASCAIVVSQLPGTYPVTATFAQDLLNRSSSDSSTFTVTREQTTLTTVLLGGTNTSTLSGTLLEDGVTPIEGRTLTLALDTESCIAVTNALGTGTCTVASLGGSTATLAGSFVGDATYVPASDSHVVPLQIATTLQYTGALTGDYDDLATLSATLVDASGAALVGRQVTLTMGSQSCSATTVAGGIASCTIIVSQQQGPHPVTATFAGAGLYLASNAAATFTVTREQTTVLAGSVGPVLRGSLPTLTGTLLEDGVTPIAGRTLTLTLGSQTCTAVTNAAGVASCTVPGTDRLGPATVTVSFAADAFYLAANASGSAVLYALAPGGGSFVVGDQSAVGAVTFWGAKWSRLNRVSGGDASDALKGFALVAPTACGVRWTTGPGNSPDPPAGPLPAYMAVLVTSSVTKSGPSLSGTTTHIVIVKTDAGYKDDPGHAGTGTVVATVC